MIKEMNMCNKMVGAVFFCRCETTPYKKPNDRNTISQHRLPKQQKETKDK